MQTSIEAQTTSEARDDTTYKETAKKLIPVLENLDSMSSNIDREIETLTLKRRKIEQLTKKRKNTIVEIANGQKSLTSDTKEFLDSEWIENCDLLDTIKSFTFIATIANVKDVEKGSLQSMNYYHNGYTLHVSVQLREPEWLDVTVWWSIENLPADWVSESKFEVVLLSSDPEKKCET